jgi:HK97 gp10 family phage protein
VAVRTGELQAEVHVNAPYAAALEYGTSRMAARPFLQPAIDKTRAEVITLFFRAIKSARGI